MNVPIIKSTATKAVDRTLLVVEAMENLCSSHGINIRIYLQVSKISIFSETRHDINHDFNFIRQTTRSKPSIGAEQNNCSGNLRKVQGKTSVPVFIQ